MAEVKDAEQKEVKERKNAQHHEGASYQTTALVGKKLMRKPTPNRNKKKNPKTNKVWGSTPEIAAQAKANFAKYQAEYDKKHYRQYSLKLNGYTEEDICYVIDHQDGVKDYLVGLIRADMERNPDKYVIPEAVKKRTAKQIAIRDAKKGIK